LPALKRILRRGKQGGIADLQTTPSMDTPGALCGDPDVDCLYPREGQASGLQLLTGLQREFPTNTLFPRQIAHLQAAH